MKATYDGNGEKTMPRPVRSRRICDEPKYQCFSPCEKKTSDIVILTLDEYEVIRLVDYEKMTHEQCAKQMDISRTTVTEIYESAREKIADAIINGRSLKIEGGNYRFCDGTARCCKKDCRFRIDGADVFADVKKKGDHQMRIAVTYENGEIFQHFGHTPQLKVYDVDNGKIVESQVVDTTESGHGALAGVLSRLEADVLICGCIGGGARAALAQIGVKLYGGVSGDADTAVEALLDEKLEYDPNVQCSHHAHEEGHNCGNHSSCGENHHGCSGN